MKDVEISLENNPELFADFDDSTIQYISQNCETLTEEEFNEIVNKELAKNG
jgi:hypothetical protein